MRVAGILAGGIVVVAPAVFLACGGGVIRGGSSSDGALPDCPLDDAGETPLGMFPMLDASLGVIEEIAAIAADDDGVYVVVDVNGTEQVLREPLCGGTPTLLGSRPIPTLTEGASFAFAASHRVFVVAGNGIYSVPTTGGAMATETTSTAVVSAKVAVYGGQLYWVDEATTLWNVTTGGGHTAHAIAQSSSPASWTSIAVDATRAYVTSVPPALDDAGLITPITEANGNILAIALAGGATSNLASGVLNPGNVLVADGRLYFTTYSQPGWGIDDAPGSGSIETLSVSGGSVTDLAPGERAAPGPLMMRGTTLYWIDNGGADGQDFLRKLPADGVPATIPMPDVIGLDGLVLAPSGAYWFSDGQVFGVGL